MKILFFTTDFEKYEREIICLDQNVTKILNTEDIKILSSSPVHNFHKFAYNLFLSNINIVRGPRLSKFLSLDITERLLNIFEIYEIVYLEDCSLQVKCCDIDKLDTFELVNSCLFDRFCDYLNANNIAKKEGTFKKLLSNLICKLNFKFDGNNFYEIQASETFCYYDSQLKSQKEKYFSNNSVRRFVIEIDFTGQISALNIFDNISIENLIKLQFRNTTKCKLIEEYNRNVYKQFFRINDNINNKNKLRILIISPFTKASGNRITATRIYYILRSKLGNQVFLFNTFKILNYDHLNYLINYLEIDLLVAIHAYRSGRYLINQNKNVIKIPYIIVLGGTDATTHCNQIDKASTIHLALKNSSKIVSFSREMKEMICQKFPNVENKIEIIPQSVVMKEYEYIELGLLMNYSNLNCDKVISENFDLRKHFNISNDSFVILLVAGFRPIKDVSYSFKIMKLLNTVDKRIKLIVVGPKLDSIYYSKVLKQLSEIDPENKAILLAEPLPYAKLQKAIMQSNIILNTSISEGMSNTLLEAMNNSTPIVARDNEGNKSIIKDSYNGLVFGVNSTFIKRSLLSAIILLCPYIQNSLSNFKKLISYDSLKQEIVGFETYSSDECVKFREKLIKNGLEFVQSKHNFQQEIDKYCNCLSDFGVQVNLNGPTFTFNSAKNLILHFPYTKHLNSFRKIAQQATFTILEHFVINSLFLCEKVVYKILCDKICFDTLNLPNFFNSIIKQLYEEQILIEYISIEKFNSNKNLDVSQKFDFIFDLHDVIPEYSNNTIEKINEVNIYNPFTKIFSLYDKYLHTKNIFGLFFFVIKFSKFSDIDNQIQSHTDFWPIGMSEKYKIRCLSSICINPTIIDSQLYTNSECLGLDENKKFNCSLNHFIEICDRAENWNSEKLVDKIKNDNSDLDLNNDIQLYLLFCASPK